MTTTQTPRVPALSVEAATNPAKEMLTQVQAKIGFAPNIFRTMAHSPATLETYLKSGDILASGLFNGKEQEIIALAVAQENTCDYCLSAHTAVGKMQGLTEEQTLQARSNGLEDPKLAALAKLSQALVRERGFVSDGAVQDFLDAGWDQPKLVELIAHVARNIFTNYFNHVMRTEVDFPAAPVIQ